MTAFFTWLFRTKLGNAVGLAALIGLCWWGFSSHYETKGYEKCQGEHALAVANDNIEVVDKQNARDTKTDKISDKAKSDAADAVAKVDEKTETAKGEVHVVYRDRPQTAPVAPGSCVHPVDPRVQQRIQSAVDQANAARGRL